MILQVNVEGYPHRSRRTGFYRIMVLSPVEDGLSRYWMFNGDWHFREPPNLNPPRSWYL